MTSAPTPLVFSHCSAWFSTSVPISIGHEWVNAGGTLESVDKADYLFSNDVFSHDTKSLYLGSEELVILHPQYITEVLDGCIKGAKIVPALGNFILSPEPLLEEGVKMPSQSSTGLQERSSSGQKVYGNKSSTTPSQASSCQRNGKTAIVKDKQVKRLRRNHSTCSVQSSPRTAVMALSAPTPSQHSATPAFRRSSNALSRRVLDIGTFIDNDPCGDLCHVDSINLSGVVAVDFDPSDARFRVEWLSTPVEQ